MRCGCRRKTLRRPRGGDILGSACSIESGMAEDFAGTEVIALFIALLL